MKRTYTGDSAKRSTISMTKDDVQLLDEVYKGLQKIYRLDKDKPTLSAILMVTLKKAVRDEPDTFLPELYAELQEACKRKPRINPFKEWPNNFTTRKHHT